MTVDQVDLLWRLGVALGLSSVIGLERELRQKSAGLRTNALVGTGAALFALVSQYGFAGVLSKGVIVLDPSRVAAQIVSGIGFIGGGLIFVKRDSVRGLTTAAGVWMSAAVGTAAATDLPLLAAAATGGYMVVSFAYPLVGDRLPGTSPMDIRVTYEDGRGVLRALVAECAKMGLAVTGLKIEHTPRRDRDGRTVTVDLELRGRGSVADVVTELSALDGVIGVSAGGIQVGTEV